MGLLDDAIREHLELKRKRGADTHEVERQEHEALGPPVRGEFAQTPQDPDAAELAEPALPAEHELPAEAVQAEPEPEPAVGQQTTEYTPPDVEVPDEEPRADEPPPEDPAPGEEPAGGEDVLEETPEFLQETPEHERLWFEQKPPRDFDLDR